MDVDANTPGSASAAGPRAAPPRDDSAADRLRRIRVVLIVYWLAMFIGAHIKLHDTIPAFHIRDKVLHFSGYAGLAFLLILYQRIRKEAVGWLDFAAVWGLAAGYGIFDELTQIPVGRTADPLDWLADIAGAAAGLVFFLAVRRGRGSSFAAAAFRGE